MSSVNSSSSVLSPNLLPTGIKPESVTEDSECKYTVPYKRGYTDIVSEKYSSTTSSKRRTTNTVGGKCLVGTTISIVADVASNSTNKGSKSHSGSKKRIHFFSTPKDERPKKISNIHAAVSAVHSTNFIVNYNKKDYNLYRRQFWCTHLMPIMEFMVGYAKVKNVDDTFGKNFLMYMCPCSNNCAVVKWLCKNNIKYGVAQCLYSCKADPFEGRREYFDHLSIEKEKCSFHKMLFIYESHAMLIRNEFQG